MGEISALSYAYVALWVCLSSGVIVFNKYILHTYGFPYPVALTMWHQAFCSVLAFIAIRGLKLATPLPSMTTDLYVRKIVPIGVLYAASLWLSNSAYLHLSVAFVQMLKALMPVAVYSTGVCFGIDKFDTKMFLNMAVITLGVVVASYGEINFVVIGVAVQLGAIVVESLRLVLVELLLNRAGLAIKHPFLTMYYVSPACLVCLLVPFFGVEYHDLAAPDATWHWDTRVFVGNACTALGLNVAVYLLIGKTSALTMNVASVIKDWVCIGLSNLLFYAPVTLTQVGGYCVAFVAVGHYNYLKLQQQRKQQAAASKDADDEEKQKEEGGKDGGR
mmetsp:Transcript_4858/g.16941  ORF Transcript_4858/g.16941 Transcript_4858/m.16941 type:complete len:332 (+) Transcript_4858:238-1233(+)